MPYFWKRLSFFLLLSVTLFSSLPLSALAAPTPAQSSPPSVSAEAAILIEADSGKVVFSKNASTRMPMASTTKIMTALVALEQVAPDTVIPVSAAAVGVEGSSVYLTDGEQLTLEQLLYAMLLESANDSAAAIAIGVAGSVEAFADLMNRKAESLGLTDTHFTNPHGLDHKEHYTTAQELAAIARCALQNELFRTIVSTRKTTIPHDGTEGVRLLINHNKLLRLYDGCIGVKTGFTKHSGRCLVSAAEKNGVTMIAVTLNASDDWNDHMRMLDYGFSRFESVVLCEAGVLLRPLTLVGGTDSYVMITNMKSLRATLPTDHGTIEMVIETPRFEYAAVAEGQKLGKAVFLCDTDGDAVPEVIGEIPLNACCSVGQKVQKRTFWQWLSSLFGHSSP